MSLAAPLILLALLTLAAVPPIGSLAAQDGGPNANVAEADRLLLPPAWRDVPLRDDLPSPSSFGGFEFGSRLWQHHELVAYFRMLDERSERASWEPYATSHQRRPLGHLTITAAANRERLDEIRAAHRGLTDPERSSAIEIDRLPAIVVAGYGVHGDEPSASHAAAVVAWFLCAAQDSRIDSWLDELVIRVDPCLNPDGFERFSSWSNEYAGANPSDEPWHREHRQGWPGGRTNAYWFDLNRDWMPLVHPESRGRLSEFRAWRPVLTLDFHEMGTDSTYFFQPGEPKRSHPRSPLGTRELTARLAEFHAAALDRMGTRYFTEERFDDFYPGKGSTYPDLSGAVGILFEQSSARGVRQTGTRGTRTLRSTVRNQVATSFSSFEGSVALRTELLENLRRSYREADQAARVDPLAAYAFAAPKDGGRLDRFAELLARHDIASRRLIEATEVERMDGSRSTLPAGTLIVDARQRESRLLRAIFDRPTDFEENAFYDVSAWSLPLAFDLDQTELAAMPSDDRLGEALEWERPGVADGPAIAYVVSWSPSAAPAELVRLARAGIQVHAASEAFVTEIDGESRRFEPGALAVFPESDLETGNVDDSALRQALAASPVLRWEGVRSGITSEGIDFGSGSWLPVPAPRIAVLIGDGVDRYAAGAVRHRLDLELGTAATLIDVGDLAGAARESWTAIVVAGGSPSIDAAGIAALEGWIERGGTLVVLGDACGWGAARNWFGLMPAPTASGTASNPERRPYAEADDDRALERIAGAIVASEIDLTHPIGWGLADPHVPVFRDHALMLARSASAYATPGVYDSEAVLAGYVSPRQRERFADAASIVVASRGRGRIVAIAEQPVYRGFFHGSARLFDNAVLFGPLIENR